MNLLRHEPALELRLDARNANAAPPPAYWPIVNTGAANPLPVPRLVFDTNGAAR